LYKNRSNSTDWFQRNWCDSPVPVSFVISKKFNQFTLELYCFVHICMYFVLCSGWSYSGFITSWYQQNQEWPYLAILDVFLTVKFKLWGHSLLFIRHICLPEKFENLNYILKTWRVTILNILTLWLLIYMFSYHYVLL
jgi:hypothetical protein